MSSFVFDLSRLRGCGAPEWAQSFPLLFVARGMACTIRWNVLHAYLTVACLAIAAATSSPRCAYMARPETPSNGTRSPSLSVRTQSRRFRSLGTASAYASGSSESTSAPAPELSPHIPSPFEHVRHLGSGASGVVHLVRNTTGAKGLYAMKVVKNDADGYGLGELAMLKHLTALKLEYITPLYYEVHDASDIYMFMAYKPRGTLVDVGHRFFDLPHRQYMAHCTELFKRYAIQIVHAVAGIHSKGIMHRDIKPDNILVDERGDLFLSDFGFAKEFTTHTSEHHVSWDHRSVPTISVPLARLSQLPCGTPGFMAPEMLVNNPQGDRWYGFEADWYSVGATLFEVFSGGQLPYVPHGRAPLPNLESGSQFYEAIYAEELEFPSDGPWGQVPVIRTFLELLLEVNPAERLGTAEDVMRYPVFAKCAVLPPCFRKVSAYNTAFSVDWSRVRSLQCTLAAYGHNTTSVSLLNLSSAGTAC
ncbi:kinase-like domain-containing protein [Schizophyllum commune]